VIAVEDVTFEENVQAVTCFGEEDGSVEFIILKGTAPFTITGALDDLTAANLAPGNYVARWDTYKWHPRSRSYRWNP
jgi:hypothetical protein